MDKKRTFEKMAEMMRSCCKGEGGMVDCCSMMRKMMQCYEGKEETEKKKETGKTGQGKSER
jgi:hypothetical protein